MIDGNNEKVFKIYDDQDKNYYIAFAPVGNYVENPEVIISGKATSLDSSILFKTEFDVNKNLHNACFKSIYSNMRANLFKYLNEIGLFDYLSINNEYWRENKKKQWERIFNDKSGTKKSNIQLTQAFNCGIINKCGNPSAEPAKKVIDEIYEIGCMFRHFRINKNLKLIIFLDTPSRDVRYHQINYWKRYYQDNEKLKKIQVISITHPSGQNQIIFDNLENLEGITSNKKNNAIKLLQTAKKVIKELKEKE